jgi:hypothetical protein
VVYAFGRMDIATGVDLAGLLDIAGEAAVLPGADTGGHVRIAVGRGGHDAPALAPCADPSARIGMTRDGR